MQLSIEYFLLINFVLNALLIAIVSRSTGVFRISRVVTAALIAAFISLLNVCFPDPWLSPCISILQIIPLSMLISGSADIRAWYTTALMLLGGIILAGGSVRMISENGSSRAVTFIGIPAGLIILWALTYAGKRKRDNWNIELCISVNSKTTRFTALIDTGNRLHEPMSGLPVIIAEREVLESILPENNFRHVAYGGLGGNGVLECFRPDFIWIVSENRYRRAPDAWVALSPVRLPGTCRALAPCEFAAL